MEENETLGFFKRALDYAKAIQRFAEANGLHSNKFDVHSHNQSIFDLVVTDVNLNEVTKQLFVEEHYALAVEEAYKYINNLVKVRSNITADGADLMRTVFSPKNPYLRINRLKTASDVTQQQGYMDILAGCMTGIRNPRAHQHSYLDSAQPALEMLSLANHLTVVIKNSKRVKRKSVRKNEK